MKRLALAAFLAVVSVAYADRTDVWLSSSVKVDSVNLQLMDDGGCRVIAQGRVMSSDGGTSYVPSSPREVAGANLTTCLDIFTKSTALFKADQGL